MLKHAPFRGSGDGDPLLTPAEAAQALRIDTVTLGRWARGGRIDSIELPSGHRRYRQSVVDAILGGAA